MGVKFEYNGNPRAIWFSIEQTTAERRAAAKTSGIIRGLVKHLVEVCGKDEISAKKYIDSDYTKGVLVFKELPTVIDLDEEADRAKPMDRKRIIQKDYLTGVFEVLAAARDMDEFKDFSWDALMLEANAEEKQGARLPPVAVMGGMAANLWFHLGVQGAGLARVAPSEPTRVSGLAGQRDGGGRVARGVKAAASGYRRAHHFSGVTSVESGVLECGGREGV